MLQVFGKAKRAQLSRTLNLACGCSIELPEMDSAPTLINRVKLAFQGPRYLTRCKGDPRHRSLAEVLGS